VAPSAELKVCAPLAVDVKWTVSGEPGPAIWKVKGTLSENACPPSPVITYEARVGEGEPIPNDPVPLTVRCPVEALTETEPVPVVGRTILPKANPVELVTLIGR
jgi:hypothetical protein